MATANQNAQGLVLALFNASAGGNLANLAPLATTASATNSLGANLVAVAALVTGKNLSDNTTFRDTLLSNLQIKSTSAAFANAKAWVDGQLATPGTDKGSIAGTAVTYLLSLTDATNPYYAAAQTFQTRNDTAVTWSTSSAGSAVLSATALIAQQATVDNYVAPPPPPVGITTVALTTANDALVGGTGVDTFTGSVNALASGDTFNVADTIDGSASIDILNLSISKDFGGFTVGTGFMKGVETVNITNTTTTDRTFNARSISDVTSYNVTGQVNLTGVSTITAVNFSAVPSTSGTALTVGFDGTAVSGTSDSLTMGLNAVGTAPVTSAGITEIDPIFTVDGIENLTVQATGANYAKLGSASAKALTVNGTGSLTLKGLGTSTGIKTVDASALTGALDITLTDAGNITSIKTGAGADIIRATASSYATNSTVADLTGNATIDGGAGANTLRLASETTTSTAANVAYAMSNVQTVYLDSVLSTLNFSGASSTGISTIFLGKAAGNSITSTFSDMGTGNITVTDEADTNGATTLNHTLSVDNSGTATVNVQVSSAAVSSATAQTTSDSLTFTKASALNVNVPANALYTVGTLTANAATAITLAGAGNLGSTATTTLTVASAAVQSLTINQTSSSVTTSSVTVNKGNSTGTGMSALTSLNLSIAGGLTFATTDAMTALQSLTVANNAASAFTVPSNGTAAINTLTLSGTNASSAIILGALGGTSGSATQAYGVSLTATGLAGTGATNSTGLYAGTVSTGANQAISLDVSGVKGAVEFGNVAVTAGTGSVRSGSITINANGMGDGVGTDTFKVGTLTAKTVSVDVGGVAGAVTVGAITADDVTFKAATAQSTVTLNDTSSSTVDITAKNTLSFTGSTLQAAQTQVDIATGSTAFTGTINGSILADNFDFTSKSTVQSAITLSGALGAGSNTVSVTSLTSTASGGQTIDISGLTGVTTSVIKSGLYTSAVDTIKGSTGNDTIYGGFGADILTGGGGNDNFVLFIAGDTGAVGSVTKTDGTTATFSSAYTVVAGDRVSTTGFDKITDFNVGDTVIVNVANDDNAFAGIIAAGTAIGATSKLSGYITGTYSASANTFTFSSSGADTLYEFDADGTLTGAINAIVLIGYSTTGSATNANSTGIIGTAA